MTKDEIMKFINENPTCCLATVEEGEPRLRGMRLFSCDANGILFQTWKLKDLHKQLAKNPQAEICFNGPGLQVRVRGKMELVEDLALQKAVAEKRPFMKPVIESRGGWSIVALWRLKNGQATVWTMPTNFEPKTYIQL
jgi:pyridoxamine 5'-phosphate oxidase